MERKTTPVKIDIFASFNSYHDAQTINMHPRQMRKLCRLLQWPGERSPLFTAVSVFTWTGVDFTEIQLSYHHYCWKKAIYKIHADGTPELLCKSYKVPRC